jgi:uncharacterized damage-inducible protein DinB
MLFAAQLRHIMQPNLQDTISLLAHTPAGLNALLRGLPDTWTRHNEGENTWTVADVVGHLIHSEQDNWIPRAKMILEKGESQTFTPLNRTAFADVPDRSLAQLLDEFAQARDANLAQLRALNIRPEDLERRGTHPVFGPVTLSQLLSTWAAHDLTHLHQISRIMAHQYRGQVGPYIKFLGVLKCEGHSDAA